MNPDDPQPFLTWKMVVLLLGTFLIVAGCEVFRYRYGVGIFG